MFGWLEIGIKFIKTLAGQGDDRSGPDAPSNQQELEHGDLTSSGDSIVVPPEGQISIKAEDSPNGQELTRRREIVRHFFNEFWSSTDEKPGTFAERLNQAEDYINGRLTAGGEAWLLDSATRRQLGLPPQSHRG